MAHRWCQHSINILTLLLCILSEYQAFHHHEHYEWVTHMPGAFNKTTWPALGHKLEKGSNDTAYITKANSLRAESPRKHTSVDYENLYAMENYFWGIQKGLSLELGALDGSEENMAAPSQTGAFVAFGWDRILIEANPTFRQAMAQVSPEAFSVNAAICKKGALHYVLKSSTKHAPTSGIAEFMEASFIARFFPYLIPKGRRVASFDPATMINWADVSLPKDVSVVEVTCVTMQQVLDRAGVNRVNFMVLDVEGAELDVLKSVDWVRMKHIYTCP